jgi:hypothetical protein
MNITIAGRVFEWETISTPAGRRALLKDPENLALLNEIQRHPEKFGLGPEDVSLILSWSIGEMDGISYQKIYENFGPDEQGAMENSEVKLTTPSEATTKIDGKTAFKEIAAIAGSSAGRVALQRRANGQSLDAAAAALVARHDRLVDANDAQAAIEKPRTVGRPDFPRVGKYVPSAVMEISKLPKFEQVHKAREMINQIRHDPKHAYHHAGHPEHAQAVETMRLLYSSQYEEGGNIPAMQDDNE